MANHQMRVALKVFSLHYGLKGHKKIQRLVLSRLSWGWPGRGGGEGQTRANANSSRLADIKFAFILCSVIYDTDLSHAVDVRTLVIVFSVRVYRRNKRRRSNWAEWKQKEKKRKEENEQRNREVKRAANEKNESDTNGTKREKSEIILALRKRLEVIARVTF